MIESTDIFSEVLFLPLPRYTWLYNNIQVNQCQLFRAPWVFYFSDTFLTLYASLLVFVLYSCYDDTNSSKKLNEDQAFEYCNNNSAFAE